MTADPFAPSPRIERDPDSGKPLIVPPGGGEPLLYDRVSGFAKALDDGFGLAYWKQCMVLLGAAQSPTIVRAAKTLTYDDNKSEVMALCERAIEKAGGGDKAIDGTTMHTLTELIDTGRALPPGLDDGTVADLEAYRKVTTGLTTVAAEQFVVCDELRLGGTFDRLQRVEPGFDWPEWLVGRVVIGDVKTGNYKAAVASIAVQLAVYANSELYDPETGVRSPLGADHTVGLIIGLPFGTGTAEVLAVSLTAGWHGAIASKLALEYRAEARMQCGWCKGTGFFKNGKPCRSCKGNARQPLAVSVRAA